VQRRKKDYKLPRENLDFINESLDDFSEFKNEPEDEDFDPLKCDHVNRSLLDDGNFE
jgi:hypothetical protein